MNHTLIPSKAFLFVTLHTAIPIVIPVHIGETISFGHLFNLHLRHADSLMMNRMSIFQISKNRV